MHNRSLFLKTFTLIAGVLLLGASCIRIRTGAEDGGVFLSRDGGISWEQKVFVRKEKDTAVTIGREEITTALFDPKNSAIMYCGTTEAGVYRSENGGDTWTPFFNPGSPIHAIAVNPKDANIFFVAADTRVYRTTTKGKAWETMYIETRQNTIINDLALDVFNPHNIAIALSNGDYMRSTDSGESWSLSYHVQGPILRILMHPEDTRITTLLTKSDGLHRTVNLGKDWQSLRASLEQYSGALNGQALLLDTKNPEYLLYFSQFGLLQSKNGGKSWDKLSLLASPTAAPITVAAIAPKKPEQIYYATATTLYRSRDNGTTWSTRLLPTTKRPSVLLVHPNDPQTVYLAVINQKK